MLMFHNTRMGIPTYVAAYSPTNSEGSYWTSPYSHWYQPHYPIMTEVIDDVHSLPPSSPQSEDSTSSSNLSGYHTPDHLNNESHDYYASFKIHANTLDNAYEVSKYNKDVTALHFQEHQHYKYNAVTEFQCKWKNCKSTFSTLHSLSNHVATAHSDSNGGLFYCGWEGCIRGDKGFNARYKMLVHVRTHTNEKPHKCNQCEKSFSRAENLKIHIRSHSGEKPYVCPVPGCNKAYSNSSDRFKHTRTHSVDKPYCCKIPGCQKRYTDPSSLRKHIKTYKHTVVSTILKNVQNSEDTDKNSEIKQIHDDNITKTNSCENTSQSIRKNLDCVVTNIKNDTKLGKRKYNCENDDNLDNFECVSPRKINISVDTHVNLSDDSSSITKDTIEEDMQIDEVSHRTDLKYQISEEPLNLKRYCDADILIYENGVLNLEKRLKTEETNALMDYKLVDIPLDLSLRKSCS